MVRFPVDPANIHENSTRQAVFTGSISGATLTVTAVTSGIIRMGTNVVSPDVLPGTRIAAYGTGTGGTGTYTVTTQPYAVPSQIMRSGLVQLPMVAGGPAAYWFLGSNARSVFTTTASFAKIRMYSTASPNPYGQRVYPTQIPYRVNGHDYWASVAQIGDGWYEMLLPGDGMKTVELFVPIQNAIVFGQTPVGVWPIEVEFNGLATPVAPSTTNAHCVFYGDSITVGGYAPSMVLQGFAGIMKRGTSDKYLPTAAVAGQPTGLNYPLYKGAYSAGTLYAVGDVVLYNNATWLKKSAAAAGTTPAVGANWTMRGFDGRVTTEAYGSRRLFDDCASAAAQTAFANHLAALVGTVTGSRLVIAIGTNDWASGFANIAAFQAAMLGLLNGLAASSASTIPVTILTPFITTSRETAGRTDMSLPNIRTALAAAATASTKSGINVLDGTTAFTTANLVDGVHPDFGGHQLARNLIG
jgi:lysophospholipase L1-like esterase